MLLQSTAIPQDQVKRPFGGPATLMFIVTALFWFSQYAITPYINSELIRMGATGAVQGLVGSVYGLSQMLLRLPLGLQADRMGRQKPFIVIGCLLSALAVAGFFLWYTPMSFVVLRGVAGVASASWVSFTVLFGSYFPPREGPQRISQLNIANQGGRLLCFVLIGWAVSRFTLQSAFVIGAAVGGLCLALSLLIRENRAPAHPVELNNLWQVLRDRNMQVTCLLGFLVQTIAFGTYFNFANNLAVRLHASAQQLSSLSVVLTLPAVLTNLFASGWLVKRLPIRRLITFGFGLAVIYCTLAPLATTMLQLYACQALAGVSSGLTFSLLLGQGMRDIDPSLRSTAMGLFQTVYGLGMTLGPLLMGLVMDARGLNQAFFLMAGISLLTAVLTAKLLK